MWPVSYNSTSSLLSMIRTFGSARCAATHSVLTSASGWAYSVEDIIRETTQRKPVRNQTLLVRRVWCLYHRSPFVTTMIGEGLEGCGPSQPRCAEINTISRRRRSGRPPGDRPAMAHPFVATMIGKGLEGYGPSQPLPAVNQHGLTAP